MLIKFHLKYLKDGEVTEIQDTIRVRNTSEMLGKFLQKEDLHGVMLQDIITFTIQKEEENG